MDDIENQIKTFSSLQTIFHKLKKDGSTQPLLKTLSKIINDEVEFAVTRLSQLNKKENGFDLKTQVLRNTNIFKENLKLIT